MEFLSSEGCLKAFNELSGNILNNTEERIMYNWTNAKSYTIDTFQIDIEIRISEIKDEERKSNKAEAAYYKYYAREEIKQNQSENHKYSNNRNYHNHSNANYYDKHNYYGKNYHHNNDNYYSNMYKYNKSNNKDRGGNKHRSNYHQKEKNDYNKLEEEGDQDKNKEFIRSRSISQRSSKQINQEEI